MPATLMNRIKLSSVLNIIKDSGYAIGYYTEMKTSNSITNQSICSLGNSNQKNNFYLLFLILLQSCFKMLSPSKSKPVYSLLIMN